MVLGLVVLTAMASMVPPSPVVIYTTPGCQWCSRAKAFLRRRGVAYTEEDVSEDEESLKMMLLRAGSATLPQIFIDGDHIGGCSELMSAAEEGTLANRLRKVGVDMVDEVVAEAPDECDAEAAPQAAAGAAGSTGSVLNPPIMGAPAASASAAELAYSMQRRMLRELDDCATEEGFDYCAMRLSEGFAHFVEEAGGLCELDVEQALGPAAPASERMAFWLNLYNCLVLHATATLGAPTTAAERTAFFSGASGAVYRVGDMRFSLDDIEHGVLRCNACHPTTGALPFAEDDPRRRLALETLDPRLHFALNCGAKSCPPIKLYSASRIDETMSLAARAFLETDLHVDVASSKLSCTRLLDWYAHDFGADPRSRVAALRDMLPPSSPLHASLGQLAEGEPTLEFRPYDWGTATPGKPSG